MLHFVQRNVSDPALCSMKITCNYQHYIRASRKDEE